MIASYHTHTTFSDGKASVSQMVEAAAAQGVDELGISDHFTLPPSGRPPSWSMPPECLTAYVEQVSLARDNAPANLSVRLGLELDWFDDHEDTLADIVNTHPFDYIIGSVHFVGGFGIDGNPNRWNNLSQNDVDTIHRQYWQGVARMANSSLFDIAAHLDLPKKFGHLPIEQPWKLIDTALDAIADHGMVVELNTSGWSKACADAYPSLDILRRCHQRGISTTLSADAHKPEDLLRDFDRGADRLREAGYTHLARFADRSVSLDPF